MTNYFTKLKSGIRGRIITSFILLVILPFVLLVAISFGVYQNYAKKTYGTYMLESLSAVSDQLDNKSKTLVESNMMYYYNGIVELLSKKDLKEETITEIRADLSGVMNSYPDISAIYLDYNGQVIRTGINYQDFMDYVIPYQETVIETGGRHVWLPVTYLLPKQESGYKFIMGKSLNAKDEKNIGIIYIVVDEEKMISALKNMNVPEGTQYLMDSDYNLLYCSEVSKIATKMEESNFKISEKSGYYIGDIENEKSLIAYYKSYKTNWTAVITIPMGAVMKDFIPIKVLMVIISIIYVGFLAFMLLLLERTVFWPIRNLTVKMDTFAEGDFEVKIEEEAIGELGKMNQHFNNMTVRLVDLMKKNEREVKEKNNFKMQSLTAQLNPHFIYNSLNTIKWMAAINKQENIQGLTDALIKILMNSSKMNDDYYTVQDELDLIQNYAVIQKARFMNFEITYHIDDKARSCKIRKFLVQPIVENAIVHGFARGANRNGLVEITISRNDNLHIEVADNGRGFNVEQWRSTEKGTDKNHTNIALKNIAQIIGLEYGLEYGITIISEKDVGTKVSYLLPAIDEGKKDDKNNYSR